MKKKTIYAIVIVALIVSVSVAAMTSFARILESKYPVSTDAVQSTKIQSSETVDHQTSEEVKNLSRYATLSTENLFSKVARRVSVTSFVSVFAGVVDPVQIAI